MSKMDIVACIDKGFVMPTGVMVYSLCFNNQNVDIVFHFIIDESVTERDKQDLKKTVCDFKGKQVEFYYVNSAKVDHFPDFIKYGPTLATYYRLFLTEILPDTIDKVLYLDGDVIVRKSLLPLWNIDISQVALAAVPDICMEEFDYCDRLDYSPHLGYFNAGVLLINLRYWRDQYVSNLFTEYLMSHYDKIVFHDQDVLNYIFRNHKMLLPVEYNLLQNVLCIKNYSKYKEVDKKASEDPAIIHYSGMFKPWNAYIRQPHPFDSIFYKYQSQTRWKGVKIENRPLKMRIENSIADILRWLNIKAPLKKIYVEISPIE